MDITTDKILAEMKHLVETNTPTSPNTWLEYAARLNVLAGDDESRLAELEYDLAVKRQELACKTLPDGQNRSMTSVNAEVRSLPQSKEIALLRAKIGRIDEFIRISKLQARLVDNAVMRQ
jgi:hypothetical protein